MRRSRRAFLAAHGGSGLVIQNLARCQLIPMRAKFPRMPSPLSRRGVIPRSNQTSATRSSVHVLLGFPKVRGL
jgi:hypothetical protein